MSPNALAYWQKKRDEIRLRIGLRIAEPTPSLDDQLESLLDTVWKAEAWERRHPFTAAIQREVRM